MLVYVRMYVHITYVWTNLQAYIRMCVHTYMYLHGYKHNNYFQTVLTKCLVFTENFTHQVFCSVREIRVCMRKHQPWVLILGNVNGPAKIGLFQ